MDAKGIWLEVYIHARFCILILDGKGSGGLVSTLGGAPIAHVNKRQNCVLPAPSTYAKARVIGGAKRKDDPILYKNIEHEQG